MFVDYLEAAIYGNTCNFKKSFWYLFCGRYFLLKLKCNYEQDVKFIYNNIINVKKALVAVDKTKAKLNVKTLGIEKSYNNR